MRTDGAGAALRRRLFHILCSDGSRTHCLLCADIDLGSFSMASQVFWSMFAHISQCVREQPDTGYRKSLRRRADPAPGIGGGCWCGFLGGNIIVRECGDTNSFL